MNVSVSAPLADSVALDLRETKSIITVPASSPKKCIPSTAPRSSKRSRSGCVVCRKSKVKCDEKVPACSRCVRRNEASKCVYVSKQIQFKEDFESRGAYFGREGAWSKSGKQHHVSYGYLKTGSVDDSLLQPPPPITYLDSYREVNTHFLNSTVENMTGIITKDYQYQNPKTVRNSYSINNALFYGLLPSGIYSNLGYPSTFILSYYLEKLSPILSPSSTISGVLPQNSCSFLLSGKEVKSGLSNGIDPRVIIPFARSHTHVFHTLLALAACHMSRTNQQWKATGVEYKGIALKQLRQRLQGGGTTINPQVAIQPDVLVTMMLLCLYEIADDCDENWTIHLKAARDIINFSQNSKSSLPSLGLRSIPADDPLPVNESVDESSLSSSEPITKISIQFFAYQDVIGRTACGEPAMFDRQYWVEDAAGIDEWIGCSNVLIGIISDITDLSYVRRQFLDSRITEELFSQHEQELLKKAGNIEDEIHEQSPREIIDYKTLLSPIYNDRVFGKSHYSGKQCLLFLSEAKRLATIVFLNCSLYDKTPFDSLVSDYVQQILKLIKVVIESNCSRSSLIWPLFVAACELSPFYYEDETEFRLGRAFILDACDKLNEFTIGNINKTREIIVNVWKKRDLSVLDSEVGKDTMLHARTKINKHGIISYRKNDWEEIVEPESYRISLA